MEIHDMFMEQAKTSSGTQKGFAVLILDVTLKSKEITKITNILKELQDRVEINYKPKVILLSAQVISDSQIKRYQSLGIDLMLNKPLSTEEILRVFKKCHYDYKKYAAEAL